MIAKTNGDAKIVANQSYARYSTAVRAPRSGLPGNLPF
jgi:hypothetical protein